MMTHHDLAICPTCRAYADAMLEARGADGVLVIACQRAEHIEQATREERSA